MAECDLAHGGAVHSWSLAEEVYAELCQTDETVLGRAEEMHECARPALLRGYRCGTEY